MHAAHENRLLLNRILARARRISWRHPEWWLIALSASAWLTIIGPSPPQGILASHSVQAHEALRDGEPAALTSASLPSAFSASVGEWILMVVAMMLPLIVLPARHLVLSSSQHRRHPAMLEFVSGYLSIWILVGLLSMAVLRLIAVPRTLASGAIAFSIAAVWELTEAKRRAVAACHTIPRAPQGWRGIPACMRYGYLHARSCVASCWALMFASMLASHSALLMGSMSLLCAAERYAPGSRRSMVAAALAIAAAANAIAAVLIP